MAHSTNPNPDDKPQSVGGFGFGFGFGTSVKCLLDCAAIRFTTSFGKQKQNREKVEEVGATEVRGATSVRNMQKFIMQQMPRVLYHFLL